MSTHSLNLKNFLLFFIWSIADILSNCFPNNHEAFVAPVENLVTSGTSSNNYFSEGRNTRRSEYLKLVSTAT